MKYDTIVATIPVMGEEDAKELLTEVLRDLSETETELKQGAKTFLVDEDTLTSEEFDNLDLKLIVEKIAEKVGDINTVLDNADQIRLDLNQANEKISSQKEDIEVQKGKLAKALDITRGLEQKIQTLSDNLSVEIKAQVADLSSRLQEQTALADKWKTAAVASKEALAAKTTELEKVAAQYDELNSEFTEAQDAVSRMTNEAEEDIFKINSLNQQIIDLTEKLNEKPASDGDLMEQLSAAKNEVAALSRENNSLKSGVTKAQKEVKSTKKLLYIVAGLGLIVCVIGLSL